MAIKKVICILILSLFFLTSNPFPVFAFSESEKAKVPHITAQQAFALFMQNKIILLDVHLSTNKRHASILGAIYTDPWKIDKKKFNFPKGKLVGVF